MTSCAEGSGDKPTISGLAVLSLVFSLPAARSHTTRRPFSTVRGVRVRARARARRRESEGEKESEPERERGDEPGPEPHPP